LPEHKDFIAIGKIVRPIGIKGNLKVIYLTDFPERFSMLKRVFLFDEERSAFIRNNDGSGYEFPVSFQKPFANYLNIGFEGFESIESTKVLINKVIMINEKDRVKIEEGNYYYYELIGMELLDKNIPVGKIKKIVNYGSGDLFCIDVNGKEILIPYRKEFIVKIDTESRTIHADLIEGFLE
jgi:16S rRNA processing protein RimM